MADEVAAVATLDVSQPAHRGQPDSGRRVLVATIRGASEFEAAPIPAKRAGPVGPPGGGRAMQRSG